MSTVNANTTIDSIQDSVVAFKGQNVDITTVTVQQGAEEPAKGSDEHTTTFNATYDLGKDGIITIEGSTSYHDNLNLKVKGTADNNILESIGDVQNVSGNIKIDMSDANATSAQLSTSDLGGASTLSITGNSADKITVNNNISSVNTGAGNDTIILDSTKKITTTVDGGAGTDAVIANVNSANVTLKNVEILAGTGTVSKAALTSVKQLGSEDVDTYGAGVDAADITVEKLGTSSINLSNLKAGGENVDAKINLNGVKGGTITLSKEDANITETITLDNKAVGVKIKGIADGDGLNISGLVGNINGKFVELDPAATTVLQNTTAYYINADGSTAEKALEALGTVALADGHKALVAFNTNKGTYIYSVSGGASITASNFTLAAIVDDTINNKDSIASGEITFKVDDTANPLTTTTVEFANLSSQPLDLTAATYEDKKAIAVTDVSGGALSVSGANPQIKVEAFITSGDGSVKRQNDVTSTVNVYLGGSKTAAGTDPLDFSGVANNAIFSGAATTDKLYANTTGAITLSGASSFGDVKLDLSKVNAQITISGAVTATTDLNDLFVSGDANDTITFAINSNASGAKITGTDAAENLTASGANASSGAIDLSNATIDLGAGNDTLFVKYANISGATINLGDGDDVIKIISKNLEGAIIDGGAGRNTLAIYGDTTPVVSGDLTDGTGTFIVKDIQVLQTTGTNPVTVNVSILNGQSLTLTEGKGPGNRDTLRIKADEQNIDLSKLNTEIKGKEKALTKLDLIDVGSGATTDVTVKLTTEEANITETIQLASGAKDVVFTNFIIGTDKIDYSAINDEITASGVSTKLVEGKAHSSALQDKDAFFVTLASDYSKASDGSAFASAFDSGDAVFASSVSGSGATIVAKYNNKTAIYQLTADDVSGLGTGDTVKLIATIDSAVTDIDAAKGLFGTLTPIP